MHGKLLTYAVGLCKRYEYDLRNAEDLVHDFYIALIEKWSFEKVWEHIRNNEELVGLLIWVLRKHNRHINWIIKLLITNYDTRYSYKPDFSYWYEYLDLKKYPFQLLSSA